jgi:hypothetical protein
MKVKIDITKVIHRAAINGILAGIVFGTASLLILRHHEKAKAKATSDTVQVIDVLYTVDSVDRFDNSTLIALSTGSVNVSQKELTLRSDDPNFGKTVDPGDTVAMTITFLGHLNIEHQNYKWEVDPSSEGVR